MSPAHDCTRASLPTISLEQYLHGTRYATPQRLAWHASGDIHDLRGTELGASFDAHYIALVDDLALELEQRADEVLRLAGRARARGRP